jgi:D-amino-acid dehydrogenase
MGTRAVVVGAGAIGVACAHYLAEEGFEVTLVDRGEVGRGCSYANAGLICPGHSDALPGPGIVSEGLRHLFRRESSFTIRPRPDATLARWLYRFWRSTDAETYHRSTEALTSLSRLSLELHDDLVRRGRSSFGFRRGPLLTTWTSPGWRDEAAATAEELRELGFTADVLERDELLASEPALSTEHTGGLRIDDQGSGDCFAYVRSLAAGLRAGGAAVLEGTTVHRVIVRGGGAAGVSVGEPLRELPAELVVLAAGAWSPMLAGSLGLRLPIQPATGYSTTLPRWEGAPTVPLLGADTRVIVLPLEDRVRFAGTLELAGFRREADPARSRAVVRAGLRTLREPPPTDRAEHWFGFRPLMPDDRPAIGWVPGVEGVLVAAGHGTLGFTQSPATGKLIAELAAGRATWLPLEPFRPDRF